MEKSIIIILSLLVGTVSSMIVCFIHSERGLKFETGLLVPMPIIVIIMCILLLRLI